MRAALATRSGSRGASRPGRAKSRQGHRGSTAVEFAIVIVPLMMLICGLFEVGLVVLSQGELRVATSNTARALRLNAISPLTTSAVTTSICANVKLLANCSTKIKVDIRSKPTFKELRDVMPADPVTVTSTGVPASVSGATSVIATYDWTLYFPGLNLLLGNVSTDKNIRRLTATSIFRTE